MIISVPVMVWGSTLVLKVMDRYPAVIYIGSAVLAYTAGSMITGEPFLKGFFVEYPILKWALIAVIVVGVLLIGRMKNQAQKRMAEQS